MFHFPDSDTGYYDTERAYRAEDARMEAQQLSAEQDWFECEAEDSPSTLCAGESDLDQATRRAPIPPLIQDMSLTAHPSMWRRYLGLPEIPEVAMRSASAIAVPAEGERAQGDKRVEIHSPVCKARCSNTCALTKRFGCTPGNDSHRRLSAR
jgi:hypothetical protein